jgi:hypothetical protein
LLLAFSDRFCIDFTRGMFVAKLYHYYMLHEIFRFGCYGVMLELARIMISEDD